MVDASGFGPELADWKDVQSRAEWRGLLIGNGSSRAVWELFAYTSLFDVAKSNKVGHPLSAADLRLFEELETENFEQILRSLSTARLVSKALDLPTAVLRERYRSVRRALVDAVKQVHVPWNDVPAEVLEPIRRQLRKYRFVYSTNYDLLLYWAIMAKRPTDFIDFFFTRDGGWVSFDLANTSIGQETTTAILYLHGGLHLYRHPTGETKKRVARPSQNLLDLFGQEAEDVTPLIITEGTANQKLASIRRSDYLTFAYEQFKRHDGPLVIFGQSLGSTDLHIVNAMKKWGNRKVAIGLMPKQGVRIVQQKHRLKARLPLAKLSFFDATTHPLGKKSLRIEATS